MYIKDYIIRNGKNILIRFPKKIVRSIEYIREFRKFKALSDGRFPIAIKDAYPCLTDKIKTTPFDRHYTYHPAWAARKLQQIAPKEHVDISSILSFSTIISAFIPTRFYDYRPAEIQLSNFVSGAQDLKQLTFEDESIESLSCMHTIEHIGLGRYGDSLDPEGDLISIKELKRVLQPGGSLLFVTPVGKPQIEFNAHRIYSFEQITKYFAPFVLRDFSLVTDVGDFVENADPKSVESQKYGCGCFWFIKNK
ncbi:MAG: hypothetical protein JWR72_1576 [Flavisolibacter sp.]|nr:hypothetical protein [Flavisolibacter sp.]